MKLPPRAASFAAAMLLVLAALPSATVLAQDAPAQAPKLRLLVLGGTGFSGPHVVAEARRRGFEVTLFNRGRTRPDLFPELETLHGDRDPLVGEGLSALEQHQGSFDAVIDTSGHVPRHLKASCDLLADKAGFYVFVSSLSAYASHDRPGADEDAPLAPLLEESEDFHGEAFGPLKALCEAEVRRAFEGRSAVVRPGLIVGPGDFSDRFTSWVARMERGGEVLAPGTGDDPVMVIDVRDLARFLVDLAEKRVAGTFNAIGPERTLTMRELLETMDAVVGNACRLAWVDARFLEANGIVPWNDIPVWMPAEGELAGFHQRSIARALANGIRFRPIAVTVRDTLTWLRTERGSRPMRRGLAAEREADLLERWHASEF